jgi:2-hydroxychromene-2-carboxylate isomerase
MAIDQTSGRGTMPPAGPLNTGERMLDFYFDFISPFGFFASLSIDALAARHGYGVRWHSMLIGVSVVKVMGMKPLLETPLKGPYILNDGNRYARQHNIVLGRKIDDPMVDPRPAGKAYNWIAHHFPDRGREFAQRLLGAYWQQGLDISQLGPIQAVLIDMGLGTLEVTSGIAGEEASTLLRKNVEDSLARGVFGSPFFLVGEEPFFGLEKMELLEEWLATGGW